MTYSWLVENFTKEGQSTGLYMLCQVNMTVTADVNAARKFRLQRTAEFRAADMREAKRGDWRAVEHGFDDSQTPNARLTAHQESECLRLLHAEIERLSAALRKANDQAEHFERLWYLAKRRWKGK